MFGHASSFNNEIESRNDFQRRFSKQPLRDIHSSGFTDFQILSFSKNRVKILIMYKSPNTFKVEDGEEIDLDDDSKEVSTDVP